MAERKTLLLTGASRGIGHATVKYFNAAGWRVFTASRQSWASECPWADGEENHIHLDLEDIPGVEASLELIREARRRPAPRAGGQCRHLAQGRRRRAPRCAGNRLRHLAAGVQHQPVLHRAAGARPVRRAEGGAGNGDQRDLHRRLEGASIRRGGLRHFQGGVVRADPRDGPRLRPAWGAGERHRAGEIDTSILSPGTEEIVERSIPLHRLGRPEEIASLIYFLCTSGASYVNGAEIHVNGGQHV